MKRRQILILAGVLLLLVVSSSIALAAPPFDTYVEEGEVIPNDIVLFEGDLEVAEDALIQGDVTLFNGDAIVAGSIAGDLVLFNGDLTARSTAVIEGDCILLNGDLEDETEGGLNCTNVEGVPNFIPPLPDMGAVLSNADVSRPHRNPVGGFFIGLAEAAARTVVLALLAFGVGTLAPQHLRQVEMTVRQKPVASGAVGVLTAVAVPSLLVLLIIASALLTLICIGLLGFPVVLVIAAGFVAGALLGWITLGGLLGQRLAEQFDLQKQNLAATAALGTAVLTFGVGLLGALPIPAGEGLISVILLSVGLGAVVLTRFGTRSYPLPGGDGAPPEDEEKVTAVLETLPVDDTTDLKESEE